MSEEDQKPFFKHIQDKSICPPINAAMLNFTIPTYCCFYVKTVL